MITEEEYLKAKAIVEEYEDQEYKPKKIEIGKDGRCMCDCSITCPLGRIGTQYRCTKKELNQAGYET